MLPLLRQKRGLQGGQEPASPFTELLSAQCRGRGWGSSLLTNQEEMTPLSKKNSPKQQRGWKTLRSVKALMQRNGRDRVWEGAAQTRFSGRPAGGVQSAQAQRASC